MTAQELLVALDTGSMGARDRMARRLLAERANLLRAQLQREKSRQKLVRDRAAAMKVGGEQGRVQFEDIESALRRDYANFNIETALSDAQETLRHYYPKALEAADGSPRPPNGWAGIQPVINLPVQERDV